MLQSINFKQYTLNVEALLFTGIKNATPVKKDIKRQPYH